jgi:phosphopantetheine adenylyltransferase|tara:strand:+ start:65 stop:712 length:648 start_codon:yes stop_codon:yes gene_type:complete
MKFDLLFEEIIKDYSFENTNVKAIFVSGRMNPPTAGHEMVINHAMKIADDENRELFVFVTRTKDTKKNPLDFSDKVDLLDAVFDKVRFVDDSGIKGPFDAGYWLRDHGFKDVKMVAGSDRVKDFQERFDKYNWHETEVGDDKLAFKFDKFKVVSVGAERDPDSDDASGISASKAREEADKGNLQGFMQLLPSNTPYEMGEMIYHKIRAEHGISGE